MTSGPGASTRAGDQQGAGGVAITNERTPLLQHDEPIADATLEDGEEIDPGEFDVLLSRSIPASTGFLEPELTEHLLLHGPRRYSHASRARDPSLSRVSSAQSHLRARRGSAYSQATTSTRKSQAKNDNTTADVRRIVSHEDNSEEQEEQDDDDDSETGRLLDPEDEQRLDSSPYLNGITTARYWAIFSILLANMFLASFDGTIMASSHPVITSYFRASNSASWLSTSFLLTSTTCQPLLGRISDSLGRKPPYFGALIIFTVSTLWCALAQSMLSFILARAFCGIGAGGMATLGSIIISDMVPIERRGTSQSIVNVAYGVGSALGASLGGAMADHLGWRWEFGIQVPLLVISCVIAYIAIPNDLGFTGDRKRKTLWEALRIFDFKGSSLLTISLTFFTLGLNLGGNILPWTHPFVITSLVIFVLGFPTFLYSQSIATSPVMPLPLVSRAPRANLIIGNAIGSFLMTAIAFNIPLFFQAVLLTSATDSGLRLAVPSVVSSSVGATTGLIITRTKHLKWTIVLGPTLFFVGCACLTGMQRGWSEVLYFLILMPHSIGQGFQFPGTLISVLAVSSQEEQAVVTATLALWRSMGTICGVAMSSFAVQNLLLWFLDQRVQGPLRDQVIEAVRESVEAVAKLEQPYRDQVISSYETSLRWTFGCCAVLALVSCGLSYPIRLPRLGQRK